MKRRLEQYFEFDALRTNWHTEILAGVTTFITMAYIIFVNPSILRETGMPFGAGCRRNVFVRRFRQHPYGGLCALSNRASAGMGLNAYFTYTVVNGLGVSWQVALGAVFLSGVVFVVLTFFGIRQLIVSAIPSELYAAWPAASVYSSLSSVFATPES
jgi:AGZA family xanthine/uracil permease-like MFS transporter